MIFALAGNPNCGKTTLFNALTGSSAHVGNWPGVTVEHKEGYYKEKGADGETVKHSIIDLPGIYSLTPYTPEEIVSRNYLLKERPDAIINIVDATNIERNLYLTTQLLEIDRPVIVALNMMDIIEKQGHKVDLDDISKKLGVPVVAISALKGKGKNELMEAAIAAAKSPRMGSSCLENRDISAAFNKVVALYEKKGADNVKFRAVKLLEGDRIEVAENPGFLSELEKIKKSVEYAEEFDYDFEAIIADKRYEYISETFEAISAIKPVMTRSDKVDKVLTNRWAGIPIFLVIMLGVFHLVFGEDLLYMGALFGLRGGEGILGPGVALQELFLLGSGSLIGAVENAMSLSPAWAQSLICNGLLAGLDAVLSFLPQILLLFVFLTILEDTGYMARVAFIMDRAFRRFGLSGKAFMPLLMCFGCAVPGIMATRTLQSEKERKTAIFLSPFFSCGAKLPIWACVAAIVFPHSADWIVFSIYVLGIACAILTAWILGKTILKGDVPPFIMELPAYHPPHVRNVLMQLWDKFKHYLFRAATVIAGSTVVIWFLSSFGWEAGAFGFVDINQSILSYIGRGISYLFWPLGFGQAETGWMLTVAIFTGLIAKEMVVATLGTLGGVDGDAVMEGDYGQISGIFSTVTGPMAFAFMAFNLLSVPCMAAVAAANAEFGKSGRKYTFIAIAFWLITAYVVSLFVYWTGAMFTTGDPVGITVFVLAIALVAFTVVFNVLRNKKRKAAGLPSCGMNCDGCKTGCLATKDDPKDDADE